MISVFGDKRIRRLANKLSSMKTDADRLARVHG